MFFSLYIFILVIYFQLYFFTNKFVCMFYFRNISANWPGCPRYGRSCGLISAVSQISLGSLMLQVAMSAFPPPAIFTAPLIELDSHPITTLLLLWLSVFLASFSNSWHYLATVLVDVSNMQSMAARVFQWWAPSLEFIVPLCNEEVFK